MVSSDHSNPDFEEGFVRKTIIPMVEGVRFQAVGEGMISPHDFDLGIADLHRTASAGGYVLLYLFQGHREKIMQNLLCYEVRGSVLNS